MLPSAAALLEELFDHPAGSKVPVSTRNQLCDEPNNKLHDSSPRGIFITATDTGVGKTLVTSALVRCLTQRGIDVGVMKPIETGVSRSAKTQSDGARLRRAAGSHDPMADVCPYVFRLPVAPLSAARAEGTTVRMATIIRAFHALRQKHAFVVVEGVGWRACTNHVIT